MSPTSTAALPPAAPLVSRFKAFFLDYLVISAYLVALGVLGMLLYQSSGAGVARTPSRLVLELVAFGTTVLPVMLYFALLEGGPGHATFGKRRMSIRVAGRDGSDVSGGRALVRNGLKLLPWQIAHTSLFQIPGWPLENAAPGGPALVGMIVAWGLVLVYLVAMFTAGCHRTPYDRLAGTIVTHAD